MVAAGDPVAASDINRRVGTIEATTDVGPTSAGTELAIDQVTISAVNGARYRLQWFCPWVGTTAADRFFLIIRLGSGIAGTQLNFTTVNINQTAATETRMLVAEWVAAATGNQTFTATVRRQGGSGTLTVKGSATGVRILTVDRVT